jgi:hypothetical protein
VAPPAAPRLGTATSVQVNVNGAGANILGDAANEPSIAVDPTNPNRMAIGWRQFDNVASNFRQAGWAYSQDGGRTWRFPGVLNPGQFRSDPVLSFDANGAFYYANLYVVGSDYTCNVFKSTNGGVSWGTPAYAFGGDKEWLTVDRTSSIGRGHLYVAWATVGSCCGTNTFTRSTNGGTLFPQALDLPQNPQWGTMDVGPDGTLYVVGVESGVYSHIMVAKSSNAKDRRYLPAFESVYDVNLGGSVSSFASGSPNPGGLLGQLWIGVDPSGGPRSGWIYIVGSVDPPGSDPLDVMFTRSTDGGATWSAPLRLNDDPAGAWQWFATLSVAPDGRIDVVWNDTRNTGVANRSELFSSSSSDGGATWTPDTQQSPAWDSWVGWPNQNKIGDYYHMVSDLVGADLAWSATFNGEQDVWYMRIGDRDCNRNGIGDATDIAGGTSHDWNQNGMPDECEDVQLADAMGSGAPFALLQNAPNPFGAASQTVIAFDARQGGGHAAVRIYDVAGRLVRALGGAVVAGRNTLAWDGRDAGGAPVGAGVYVYRLEAPGFQAARRMVLLR